MVPQRWATLPLSRPLTRPHPLLITTHRCSSRTCLAVFWSISCLQPVDCHKLFANVRKLLGTVRAAAAQKTREANDRQKGKILTTQDFSQTLRNKSLMPTKRIDIMPDKLVHGSPKTAASSQKNRILSLITTDSNIVSRFGFNACLSVRPANRSLVIILRGEKYLPYLFLHLFHLLLLLLLFYWQDKDALLFVTSQAQRQGVQGVNFCPGPWLKVVPKGA